jgi:ubiquinone/menaquinone biosynthesis C-methylase UbiE|tara:strand:- start:2727 stop:3512 length:786 start_codon:yes stop_codon:yes gene_type:complete
MKKINNYIEINKQAWDKRTPIHIESKFYNNKSFKKKQNSLKSIEANALGNVKGKSILHLQCHFGQDSISLSKMGAKVTAVDFSRVAINEARKLAKELKIDLEFIEKDVLKLDIKKRFDIVFSSYGIIGWLPDLNIWAKVISRHLKKGGLFLLTEFHPFTELIKDSGYDYFYKPEPDIKNTKGTYTDGGSKLVTKTCWWNHSLTDIFKALESNGMKLNLFEEFDYCPYKLEGMIEKEKGKYILNKRKNLSTPYVFNLKATKK